MLSKKFFCNGSLSCRYFLEHFRKWIISLCSNASQGFLSACNFFNMPIVCAPNLQASTGRLTSWTESSCAASCPSVHLTSRITEVATGEIEQKMNRGTLWLKFNKKWGEQTCDTHNKVKPCRHDTSFLHLCSNRLYMPLSFINVVCSVFKKYCPDLSNSQWFAHIQGQLTTICYSQTVWMPFSLFPVTADIYGTGTLHHEISKWLCLPQ